MSNLVRFPIEKVKRMPEAMVQKFMDETAAPRFVVEHAIREAAAMASEENFGALVKLVEPEPEEYRWMPAYCDPDNEKKGDNYEATQNLDIAEVAKILRRNIKEAIKAGELPQGLKTSVRIDRYSMGQSMDVRVTGLPEGVQWYTDEYAIETKGFTRPADRYSGWDGEMLTKEAGEILEKLSKMRESFNRDNSDIMVDYFDVRYYGSTSIGWELDRDLRDAQLARLREEGKL